MATGRGFWITNRLANPVLRRLLRRPPADAWAAA